MLRICGCFHTHRLFPILRPGYGVYDVRVHKQALAYSKQCPTTSHVQPKQITKPFPVTPHHLCSLSFGKRRLYIPQLPRNYIAVQPSSFHFYSSTPEYPPTISKPLLTHSVRFWNQVVGDHIAVSPTSSLSGLHALSNHHTLSTHPHHQAIYPSKCHTCSNGYAPTAPTSAAAKVPVRRNAENAASNDGVGKTSLARCSILKPKGRNSTG